MSATHQITKTCAKNGCGEKKQQFCTCNDHGGFTVYVRARPWHETAFAQVLLPVALSYETFICKLCVALDVDRALVKKVLKMPDILMRTTEDVIRLRPDDRLELVLHSSFWKYQVKKRLDSIKPCLSAAVFVLMLAMVSAVALHQKEILLKLDTLRQRMDDHSCAFPIDHDQINPGHSLDKRLRAFEATLINRLKEFESKFDTLIRASDANVQHLQTLESVVDQFQQLKNLLRRKMKIKEDGF